MSTFTSFPTKEQVLEVLELYYGDVSGIMKKLIAAHKNLGRIPSHEASSEHVHYLVNEHYGVIRSVKELATEVGKEKTTNNWYYLNTLGKMLPSHEQCKLCICEGNLALKFFILEGVFRDLRTSFAEKKHSP